MVFFNPGSNTRQVSKLRLINDGDLGASVMITGIDDQGSDSETVWLTVPAGAAYTFTSAELETGENDRLTGSLGDGAGKWRLRVESDEEISVMSLLETPSGHLTTSPRGRRTDGPALVERWHWTCGGCRGPGGDRLEN